jgi:hypothetical protein
MSIATKALAEEVSREGQLAPPSRMIYRRDGVE